jgi:hypothetical protein
VPGGDIGALPRTRGIGIACFNDLRAPS